eukprot:m.17044 g.17044  ORF g.17044 m.17044 type:complete len:131 (+) comp3203_c0_seq1:113-505(+)
MLKFECGGDKLGFKTLFGQSWKHRWFRISGSDINYLVRMNEACCGEAQLTKDSRVCAVKPGSTSRPDATEAGAIVLPERPNLVELSQVSWMGRSRTFYIAFDNPADQKQFILVIQNNIKHLIDAAASKTP